ncbi:NAD-dependent epimerase/dehydratase family protein [Dermatobacter hominis]|uniref:NAD-dependent epimerase/dehydratase family protein n=1 Tax=Dermatobacter hominis TaxID=2884263 RepID=UPI001D11B93A|nr:NAD-dependent epimerase/dehydratase family protein [Dermatobacter hominis]UDY37502.1 GDP-mannose 4,6-dehydratase [Dermatobacter hominis]
MRALVAGAAGMIGSHVAEALLRRGDEVVCVDDLSTGQASNLALLERLGATTVVADVCGPLPPVGRTDAVLHLASPASPRHFATMGPEILRVGSEGTLRLLDRACADGARFLLASTSEVYGEPLEHPQREDHRGNVSTTGPRACYDEAKRFAEAAATTYERQLGADVRIARIFNTYGPRLHPDDGRVVVSLLSQALLGRPVTVHGDGSQTRCFCYVDDQVRGLLALLDSDVRGPVNIGSDDEHTITELVAAIGRVLGREVAVERRPAPPDDPTRRRPSLERAQSLLGWEPTVPLELGLARTADWLRIELASQGGRAAASTSRRDTSDAPTR